MPEGSKKGGGLKTKNSLFYKKSAPFMLKGFSYPGKAPKKRAPIKLIFGGLAGLGVGLGLATAGRAFGKIWGQKDGDGDRNGSRDRYAQWGGVRGYQRDKPYNRGWWTGGESSRGRNRAQWNQRYSSAGYKDQPYELKTQAG